MKSIQGIDAESAVDRRGNSRRTVMPKAQPANRAWVEKTVRAIQDGRQPEENFELLFREYEPQCRRFFLHRGLTQEADDLAQEVMWRVYQGIGTFRRDASFDTWITRIMTNAYKNALRSRGTDKAKAESSSLDALLESSREDGPTLAEPAATEDDPLDSALAAERKEHLAAAFRELPGRVRQSLLFHYQGYKYREIAKAQGVSLATVKKQIIEGRRRLRPILGPFVELFGVFLVLCLILG